MNAEALSRSLSFLPDSMIGEAIRSRKKKPVHFTPWLRAAACIAVVLGLLFGISFPWLSGEKHITAPSILVVNAYAFENGQPKGYEMEEGFRFRYDKLTVPYYNMLNCVPGLPISFFFPEEDMVLDITLSNGVFYDWNRNLNPDGSYQANRESNGYFERRFTIKNNRTIYWRPFNRNNETREVFPLKGNRAYVDIIMKQEEHIVGYAVICIDLVRESPPGHEAYLVEAVRFPKILGRYQEITEDYVQQQIEKVKENNI